MELLALWNIIKRRWRYSVVVSFLVILLAIVSLVIQTPLYRGRSRVIVELQNPQRSAVSEIASFMRSEDRATASGSLESVILSDLSLFLTRPILQSTIEKLDIKGENGELIRAESLRVRKPSVFGFGGSRAVYAERVGRTNVLDVSAYTPSPVEAMDIANTIVASYIYWKKDNLYNDLGMVIGYIDKEVKGAQQRFQHNLDLIRAYQENQTTIDLDTETRELVSRLEDLEAERMETCRQLDEARSRLNMVVAQIQSTLPGQPSQSNNDHLEKNVFINPDDARLYRNTDRAFEPIERDIGGLQARLASLDQQIPELQQRLNRIPALRAVISNLELDRRVSEEATAILMRTLNESIIVRAAQYSNVRIVEPATLPKKPYRPLTSQRLVIGVFLAMISGIGFALLAEYIDDTITSPEAFERVESVSYLGGVPKVSNKSDKLEIPGDANDPFYEAFRKIYHNLKIVCEKQPTKRILFAAATPHSGVTSIIACLGSVLAQDGHHVLVSDLDLRRAKLHELLGLPRVPGLANVLAQELPLEEAIVSGAPNLLTAGAPVADAGAILKSKKFFELLDSLDKLFEICLFDCAPILIKTDALKLAEHFDAVVLVVAGGITTFRDLREAVTLIRKVNKGPVFVLLNQRG